MIRSSTVIKARVCRWLTAALMLSVMLPLGVSAPSPAVAEVRPKVSIGTDAVGSLLNIIGSGISKVVTEHTKTMMVVRAFSGPDAWLPVLDRGELELGVLTAGTAWIPYNAIEEPYTKPLTNLRLLRSMTALSSYSFVVAKDSNIKAVKDLKGKRVPYFQGRAAVRNNVLVGLMTAGLGWDDVVKVPFTTAIAATEAFGQGRIDTVWATVGQPSVREVDTTMKVRYLAIQTDRESYEKIAHSANANPVQYVVIAKKGVAPGILEDTPVITSDSYLIAGASLDDETVTSIVRCLWDKTEDLFPIHPGYSTSFAREAAVTTRPTIPYHPAAIRFYKEKGVWKEEAGRLIK
jgi:TRAP transporter TAXI family solute receptor